MIPAPRATEDWQGWVRRFQQFMNPFIEEMREAYFRQGQQPLKLRRYTVANLPSAAVPGQQIYVSDESGGAVPAFSDGMNWRRYTDRAVVS